MKDFIKKCLVKDDNQRAPWEMVANHLAIQKLKRPIPRKLSPEMASIWRKLKIYKQKIEQNVLT